MILGDDIIILDKEVGSLYLQTMSSLGVVINKSKSLISNKGIGEFAKKLIGPKHRYEGLSLRELTSLKDLSSCLSLFRKLKVSRYNAMKFFGYNSRAAGHEIGHLQQESCKNILNHSLILPFRSTFRKYEN